MNEPMREYESIEAIEENQTKKSEAFDGIKEHINNLLWSRLPDKMTLKRADEIACEIYAIIDNAWN